MGGGADPGRKSFELYRRTRIIGSEAGPSDQKGVIDHLYSLGGSVIQCRVKKGGNLERFLTFFILSFRFSSKNLETERGGGKNGRSFRRSGLGGRRGELRDITRRWPRKSSRCWEGPDRRGSREKKNGGKSAARCRAFLQKRKGGGGLRVEGSSVPADE